MTDPPCDPRDERPTPTFDFGDGHPPDAAVEPLPLHAGDAPPPDPADAAREAQRELAAVAAAIATLTAHRRRVELARAAERLAVVAAQLHVADVWQLTRVVADNIGGPQGEEFEAALLDLLRAARGAP